MRILGIDPGLASTGWGVLELVSGKSRHVAHGTIETSSGMAQALRLKILFDELSAVIAEFGPSVSSVEALFFAKNVSSAIPVAHARGVALLCCAKAGVEVFEYTPVQIKQAVVGSGRAEKNQVQEMVRLILGLKEIPRPDHAADALAAALCQAHAGVFASRAGL